METWGHRTSSIKTGNIELVLSRTENCLSSLPCVDCATWSMKSEQSRHRLD